MVKKSLPVLTQERWVWSLGGEDPLKKEIATCCSIFAWENPRDQSMESRRVGHDLATEHVHRDERGLCRMQRTEDAGEREGCEDRGEPQRDSATHIHVYILPQTPLPSRLPHNIEQKKKTEREKVESKKQTTKGLIDTENRLVFCGCQGGGSGIDEGDEGVPTTSYE